MATLAAETRAMPGTDTDRVRGLLARFRATPFGATALDRPVLLAAGLRESEGQPEPVRRARALASLLERIPVQIYPGELIVGAHPVRTPAEVDQDELSRARSYLDGASARRVWREALSATGLDCPGGESRAFIDSGWRSAHAAYDLARALRLGFGGLLTEVQARERDPSLTPEQRDYLAGARLALEAAGRFVGRYAAEATRLAETAAPGRREELLEIADRCRRLAAEPARDFADAVQLVWLVHLITCLEDGGVGNSLGRLDQLLWPYYREWAGRPAAGALDRAAQARELITCLWLKINEIWGNPPHVASQQVTVGGQDALGRDAANPVTWLCLDATERLQLRLPNLSLRVSEATPDDLLARACQVLARGSGQPVFFSDPAYIRALAAHAALPVEVARGYCIVGCIQTYVPAISSPLSDSFISLVKCLELALHDGVDPVTGEQLGLRTGDPRGFASFDELRAAYHAQVAHLVRLVAERKNLYDRVLPAHEPIPFSSCLVDACIARARDANDGGARFEMSWIYGAGTGTVADSLAAIRRFVFPASGDERVLTLGELLDHLKADFAGAEEVRLMLANRAPKYGNDDDDADELAREVGEGYCQEVLRWRGVRGGPFAPILSGHTYNVAFGLVTGATPDGRKAGEPYSDGMSPAHGRDRNGPTAVLRSAAKVDATLALGGTTLNLKFLPSLLRGPGGPEAMAALLRTYFRLGGGEVQVNVVSPETLRDAIERPDHHADLVVRVSGFSAYFTALPRGIQEEIYRRTLHEAL